MRGWPCNELKHCIETLECQKAGDTLLGTTALLMKTINPVNKTQYVMHADMVKRFHSDQYKF